MKFSKNFKTTKTKNNIHVYKNALKQSKYHYPKQNKNKNRETFFCSGVGVRTVSPDNETKAKRTVSEKIAVVSKNTICNSKPQLIKTWKGV